MKRLLALALVLLMILSCLIACGGNTSNSGGNQNNEENQAPSTDENQTPGDSGESSDGSTGDDENSTTDNEQNPDNPDKEKNPDARVEFNVKSISLSVGESRSMNTIHVPMYAGDGYAKIFKSSDTGIVTIDSDGVVKALKPGTATVTVSNERGDLSGNCTITVLGTSTSLQNTIHMPPVDSQGSLGTCAHESVTYAQFTIAVSQYINSMNPNLGWNPSSGELRYIFSPKFTFNFADAGTEYAYNILMDHGCLTEDVSRFYHVGESSISGPSNAPYKETAGWDVGQDMMNLALRYRLTGYEEIDYTGTYGGNLTNGTSSQNMDLFNRVKEAVKDGNAVVICGWAYYWNYGVLTKDGDIGKSGENCIYSAANPNSGGGDGNHAVTIVGYDDNVEAKVGGYTMKGAFLVLNSWGSGWCNDGYVWMMYDAFNTQSEFDFLNTASNEFSVVFSPSDDMKFMKFWDTTKPSSFEFTAVGEHTIDGKTYTTYTIYEPVSKKYLAYNASGIQMVSTIAGTTFNEWALIPYTDIKPDATGEYKDSVLLYAVKRPKYNSISASNFFTASSYNYNITCQFGTGDNGTLACMTLDGRKNSESKHFNSVIQFTYGLPSNRAAERTSTIYRFSFIDWRTDIAIGNYGLRVEAEVSTTTRENFTIDLLRVDSTGNLSIHRPWLFEYGDKGMHNEYYTAEDGSEPRNVLSFSGVVNPTEAESGYFTLTYSSMGTLPAGSSYENFLWGIRITGHTANIKSLKLISPDGKVLSEIQLNEEYNMLKKDPMTWRKETKDYFFDLNEPIHTFATDGKFYMKNAATNSYVGFKATLFHETTMDAGMDMVFNFSTDPKTGNFILYDDDMQMVLDIYQKEIKEGVMVKFNAQSVNRANTQDWTLVYNDDGTISFRLTQYPEYYFAYDPNATTTSKFVLSTDKDSDYCKWILEGAGDIIEVPEIVFNNGSATYTATKPADNEATEGILRVFDQNGALVSETNVTFNGNDVTATVNGLTTGTTYLFVLSDGTYDIGINYIVMCK